MAKDKKKRVPKDLEDKVNSLKQLINIHDLLMQGQYQGHTNKRIGEAIVFIESLHKNLLDETQNHPDAALIPQLAQEQAK